MQINCMSLKDNYITLTKKLGGPYTLLSKGIKRGIINSIMRGSYPKINEAYEVAKALGVSLERLLIGEDRHVFSTEEQKIDKENGYIVPMIEGHISGGTGSIPLEEITEKFWIPKKYLQSPAGYDCRYVAIKVKGYSMEPLIEDDDIVLIDRVKNDLKNIQENSIYAVRKDDLYYVKHLHYEEKEKKLQLISASPYFIREHGFEYINLKEIENNPIIGKVIFSFRKWK